VEKHNPPAVAVPGNMARRTTVLATADLAAIVGGILAILLGNELMMGAGAILIIIGLVGLMLVFESALN